MKHNYFNRVNAILLGFVLLITQVAISCHKNDNEDTTPTCTISMRDMAGTYMITKIEAQLPTGSTDVTNVILADACMKDNTVVLNEDGTAKYEDKGVVCDPTATSTGTWSLSGQQMNLSITQSPINLTTATVSSYDCKTLVVTAVVNNPLPNTPVKVTLTKQ